MDHQAPKIPDREALFTPPGGPPDVERPDPSIYAAMGEAGIFRMCRDFYAELERSPIRPMFPDDMAAASERIAAFFVGLLGGPPMYHERYGHPRLRMRHLPFPIDEAARQVWLGCFRHVLQQSETYGFPARHLPGFIAWLEGFSVWMVNRRASDAAH